MASRLLALAVAMALALLSVTARPGADQPSTSPDPLAEGPCLEDEPCFDCSTMGNRLCGPVPEWSVNR